MKREAPLLRFDSEKAQDESLAAWCGWFSPAPLAGDLAKLVEQLEASYLDAVRTTPAPEVVQG